MATRYDEIIKLRGGKAAYNITEEKFGEWTTFIPNDQFNSVLRTIIKSVRANDIDNHKSFWINGTYGTGKSHAVAVISHLLGDKIEDIRDWVEFEYGSDKFASLRQAIFQLREKKRLLSVKVYGLKSMIHSSDLGVVLQKAVIETLKSIGLSDISVPTDFETYIEQIHKNPEIWDHLIEANARLSSVVETRKQLIEKLEENDLSIFHRVSDTLRETGFDVRMDTSSIKQWFIEIQEKLREQGTYNGLLIVWDEFTDVMNDSIGLSVLKELQGLAEAFMNQENDSYIFLISHPSAFDKVGIEQLKQTDGRYHRMKYNMESVSAFKIMSRKFEVVDINRHEKMSNAFYKLNPNLLTVFTQNSNDPLQTRLDLQNLFPLHPGTANLATHYATVVGSSSRSVFEFLGQNDAIRDFLQSSDHFLNSDTITAEYLWDYVLKVFQDDVTNYGAVTERYNSYVLQVTAKSPSYLAIFKGILLLNAFNNVSAENNNGLVTPSEDNIHNLFAGTQHESQVDEALQWFNNQGIIQRAPEGLYSVQFTALPSGEIEEKKNEMRHVQFCNASKILCFGDTASIAVEKKLMQRVIRPYKFRFYSDVENESVLRSQIKNGRKEVKPCNIFFGLLMARNNDELSKLRSFCEKCVQDNSDNDLKNIVFIVFDEVLGEGKYEQFIEYQANYACASSHGFVDQTNVHRDHAVYMIKEWMDAIHRGNATIYINGMEKKSISVKHLSTIVNGEIAPALYPFSPDAVDILRQRAPSTFWKSQISKEMVRTFLFATSKEEFLNVSAQMRPIQYLIQDCLDENLQWNTFIPDGHPMKVVFDKVNSIIKHADKSLPFNFDDKFSVLTKPPYGLYGNYATVGMMAFALRPWVNKIFDPQGKPRDANALIDDIVMLFKVWDDGKSNSKLYFKFQTPEEGKLCKELISLFKLNNKGNQYSDVSSLKDARYAITSDFLNKRGTPLWAIKYAPSEAFAHLPVLIEINDNIKRLIDNIVKICMERELRNPALVNDTLTLISEQRIEMKNILNVDAAFTEGFKTFLMNVPYANVTAEDVDNVKRFIEQNLQSTVGYWSEEEVSQKTKDWRLSIQSSTSVITSSYGVTGCFGEPQNPWVPQKPILESQIADKREKAKKCVSQWETMDQLKAVLELLCLQGDEHTLDLIISKG